MPSFCFIITRAGEKNNNDINNHVKQVGLRLYIRVDQFYSIIIFTIQQKMSVFPTIPAITIVIINN